MSVLRYRRSSDGAWTLLDLPAGPTGPQGNAGANGAVGPTGPQGPVGTTGGVGPTGPQGTAGGTGATGPTGPQGAVGNTGGQGPVGVDGNPTSTGNYGSNRWRIVWGTVYMASAAAAAHTAWSINFGFTYVSNLNALCTGVKNNWGGVNQTGNHQIAGAAIITVRADGLDGTVRNNGDTAADCYVAWIAWGVW